jgi:hypothetical protein
LNEFVQKKISYKGKFLIAAAAVGVVDSFLLTIFMTKNLRSTQESLLKKEVFPAWLQSERVVNPDRTFF